MLIMKRILTFLVAITMLLSFQTSSANEPCAACQTVTAFKVGTTTSTTATIYWNGVSGAKSYDVTISQALPIPFVAITFEYKGVTTAFLAATKLTAATTYTYTIKTNCTDGSASELSKLGEFTTQKETTGGGGTTTSCGTVKDFGASPIDTTSASIKWSPVSGAVSYDITVTGANGFKASYSSTTASVIANKLPGAGTYSYTIVTVCKDSKSEASKAGTFTIKKSTTGGGGNSGCGTVTDFAAFVLDSTSASIKWSPITGATSYEITVTGPKGFKATYTSTGNAVVADKLPGNGGYTYQIKAICPSGAGNTSKPGNFVITKVTIPTTGCGQVADIKVTTSTDTTSASAKWSLVAGAISYEITVTGANGFTQNYTSTTTSIAIVKLPGAGTYTVKVRAICKSGNGEWSKDKSFTIVKPKATTGSGGCGSVAAISAKAIDSTSATITWLPNFSAKSYEITITSAAGFSLTLTSATAPVTVAKLSPNTTYTVKVRAICANGAGDWSKGTTFKTGKGTTVTPTVSCGTPSELSAKAYNTTTTQLNWKAITAALSYDIEVEETTAGATATVQSFTSKINTVIIDNLKPGSSYKFRVRSICSTSTGEWSKYGAFTMKSKLKNDDDNANRVAPNTSNTVAMSTDLIRALYPNPASNGDVTIAINGKEGEGKLLVINMLGAIVKSMDINAGETRTIEIGDLHAGYYFVKVKIGDKTETKKLMVARP
jgi:Secretion system C-terminal sorting domain/Fibronectin type III domain